MVLRDNKYGRFQNRFPPEQTLQLYRGLVRDGEQQDVINTVNKSTFASPRNSMRERLRVLEVLGLNEPKNRNKSILTSNDKDKDKDKDISRSERPVDKPSYHLGSNARKRQQIVTDQSTLKLRQVQRVSNPYYKSLRIKTNSQRLSQPFHKNRVRKNQSSEQIIATYPLSNNSKFNPIQNKDYVWHPINICDNSKKGNKYKRKPKQIKDVMSHYHNMYHKQCIKK